MKKCPLQKLVPFNPRVIKILLVDDEPDILEIVGYNLSNEGYKVITAENGVEGVKKAHHISESERALGKIVLKKHW